MTPLTPDETKWLKKLQKVLSDCPSSRLGFYTIGDPDLTVYDNTNEANFDTGIDFPMAVDLEDAALAVLSFPANVVATVG